MHLSARINWFCHGTQNRELPSVLIDLLDAISRNGSLRQAAKLTGLSYRHAWGLIRKWEAVFATPLVLSGRGRGKNTRLSPFGTQLLQSTLDLGTQLEPDLSAISDRLNAQLAGYLDLSYRHLLRIQASHDLTLLYLCELLRENGQYSVDLQTRGSLDALRVLNSGQCDIAGFHFPVQPINNPSGQEYRQLLEGRDHTLLWVTTREQGILCRRGNPKKIRTLGDLTKRSVQFINRQRYSGTRTNLDQMLAREGIRPEDINGYANEEFTHIAVAALISSGAVDAGFGIKAVTAQFNLEFIPCLHEVYALAISREAPPGVPTLVKNLLESAAFRAHARCWPGIDTSRAGEQLALTLEMPAGKV